MGLFRGLCLAVRADDRLREAVIVEAPPRIIEVEADSPPKKDKGNEVVMPGASAQANEAGDGGALCAIKLRA